MPIRPELRGGTLPHISVAAAALLALTIKSIEHPTPENAHYTSETRHVDEFDNFYNANYQPKPVVEAHASRHSRTHPTPAQIARREVTPAEFKAWSKVNVCEEDGDWHIRGSEYSGGLGISNSNWINYGGKFFSPTGADATPDEQIVVAIRIQKNPPDQDGCDGSW